MGETEGRSAEAQGQPDCQHDRQPCQHVKRAVDCLIVHCPIHSLRPLSVGPQLNKRPSVRTTASAKNAAARIKNSRLTFGSITMPPIPVAAVLRRSSIVAT